MATTNEADVTDVSVLFCNVIFLYYYSIIVIFLRLPPKTAWWQLRLIPLAVPDLPKNSTGQLSIGLFIFQNRAKKTCEMTGLFTLICLCLLHFDGKKKLMTRQMTIFCCLNLAHWVIACIFKRFLFKSS